MRGVAAVAIILLGACATAKATAADSAAKADVDSQTQSRIERVEKGLEPLPTPQPDQAPTKLDLQQLLRLNAVPGFSVAVIDDFKVAWTKAYGTTAAGEKTPVTTKTLFQAASISKTVAAAGMLALVQRGEVSLDENVNHWLVDWKVPENAFTQTEKVTLRRLASHSAGVNVDGFPGYDIDAKLPTLVHILDGAAPANSPAIRVEAVPGSKANYSGGGTLIEQQVMSDAAHRDFPSLMHELVLAKLGMADSTYAQPLPAHWAARAASGTHADGSAMHGKWHVYPEMAAAGLWSTPADLAKFAIDSALSAQGKSNKVLSQKLAHEMHTAQAGTDGQGAIGFFLGSLDGEFNHFGVNDGFQAMLRMNALTGQGVVVMANSDNGILVGLDFVDSLAREYHWKDVPQPRSLDRTLILLAKSRGVDSALTYYDSVKKDAPEQTLVDLGSHLMRAAKVGDGIVVLQRNAREFPQSAQAHAVLGRAYLAAGQRQDAERSLKESLRLEPDNQEAKEVLDKLSEGLGK